MTCGYILFTVSMLPLRGGFTSCPYDTEHLAPRAFYALTKIRRRGSNSVAPSPYVLAWIWAPHLGQVMTIFPLPTGTRQMVLQFLQVKYLCSLSAWRALAPCWLLFIRHIQFSHRWFSLRRLVRFLEKMRNSA